MNVTMTTILCVEDEIELREDLAEELRFANYIVVEAGNGKEGLAAIKEHSPDLVLCDLNMPEMNGHELLQKLRNDHKATANMPFIFLTALASRTDVIKGKELGADDYLTKPVDIELLLATVESRLRQVERIDEINREELRKRDNEIRLAKSVLRRYVHFYQTTGLPNCARLLAYLGESVNAGVKVHHWPA